MSNVRRDAHLSLLLGLLLLLLSRVFALRLDVVVVDGHGLIDLGAESTLVLNTIKLSVCVCENLGK